MNWNKKYYAKMLEYRRRNPDKVREWNRRQYLKRKAEGKYIKNSV